MITKGVLLKKIVKRIISVALFYSGTINLMVFIGSRLRKGEERAVILLYHRFANDNREKHLLPYMSVGDFRRQMCYIKKWYNVISLDELIEYLNGRKGLPSPAIVVTFDDGYRSNYTLAFPILKKLDLPVTVFLTCGVMGSKKGLWIDQVERILLRADVEVVFLEELFERGSVRVGTLKEKEHVKDRVFNHLLYADNDFRKKYINKLEEVLGVEGDKEDRIMLSWEEIKEMASERIEFGAHTLTHPALRCISFDEAAYEIAESKKVLENELGMSVRHFAVPNGKDADFSEPLRKFCKEIGFKSIASTNWGVIEGRNMNPYWLERISPSPWLSVFAFDLVRNFLFAP